MSNVKNVTTKSNTESWKLVPAETVPKVVAKPKPIEKIAKVCPEGTVEEPTTETLAPAVETVIVKEVATPSPPTIVKKTVIAPVE